MEKYNLIRENDEKYWKAIESYKRDHYYVTYPYEVVASNMVNLHVFDLFNETNHPSKDKELNKLETYFERTISKEYGIGDDKYHASPYCQNSHGVMAFAKDHPNLCGPLIDWFWNQQRENGLWGNTRVTVEETAYSVLAICYAHEYREPQELEKLIPAVDYLVNNFKDIFPNLWLSKVAYTPIETVKAHIFSALELFKRVFKGF